MNGEAFESVGQVPCSPTTSDLSEANALPDTARRWAEEGRRWVGEQRARGKYLGRNGDEAERFFRRCGEYLITSRKDVTPARVTEAQLFELMPITGKAPTSRRYYYSMLGSFLMSRGNPIVRNSRFLRRFPKVTGKLRRLSGLERDTMFQRAIGTERLVLALMSVGLRRVEVQRMRVEDVDLPGQALWIRGKGYGGERSRTASVTGTIRRELEWYLPLRESWAQRAKFDAGHLIAWLDGNRLRSYSCGSIDRFVIGAGMRIGKRVTPHDLRRTMAELLRDRGANLWEIQAALGHRSPVTTQAYLEALDSAGKLAKIASLLEIPAA